MLFIYLAVQESVESTITFCCVVLPDSNVSNVGVTLIAGSIPNCINLSLILLELYESITSIPVITSVVVLAG